MSIVGEDGKRYLFVSGGGRLKLADDGLKLDGPLQKVYDGWQYPAEWEVESYSQEGPKMLRRGGYFFLNWLAVLLSTLVDRKSVV